MREMLQCIAELFCQLRSGDHHSPVLQLRKCNKGGGGGGGGGELVSTLHLTPFVPVQASRSPTPPWWSAQPCWRQPQTQRATGSLTVSETWLETVQVVRAWDFNVVMSQNFTEFYEETHVVYILRQTWLALSNCEILRDSEGRRYGRVVVCSMTTSFGSMVIRGGSLCDVG